MKKGLLSITACAVIFSLSGCGDSGSSDTNTTAPTTQTVISGVVADGHIKDATVFVDLNKNGVQDSNEPYTNTDSNGNYSLNVENQPDSTTPIIAKGGYDLLRDEAFTGVLKASSTENGNISPLTTLLFNYMKNSGADIETAKEKVADLLGISKGDVELDPSSSQTLQTKSLQIQIAAEMVSDMTNLSINEVYNDLSKNVSTSSDISDAFDKLNIGENEKAATLAVIDNIPDYVKNNKVNEISSLTSMVKKLVTNANKNSVSLSKEDVQNYITINQNSYNLTFEDYTSKIENYYKALSLTGNEASVDDVRSFIQVIRDTTYEFLNPNISNQEGNQTTIAGEYIDNYNNSVKPAIEDLSSEVNTSLNNIKDAAKQFDLDFDEDFNISVSSLKERLKAISEGINEHNITDDYNFTTAYGDELIHTYSEDDNGYITEVYSLNEKNLTAKYFKEKVENAYISTEGVTLNDENYTISLNSLSFDGTRFNFDFNGTIYGENNTKIIAKRAKLSFDINASWYDNTLDKALAFSNIDLDLNASVTTRNGTFDGVVLLNNTQKNITGNLDYSNFNGVKLNGNITINAATNDLLKIANDDDLKRYYWGDWFEFILINNSPVSQVKEYNWESEYNDTTHTYTYKEEYNLTSINGDKAHCLVTYIDTDNLQIHKVDCDNNVISYNLWDKEKIVRADLNGKDVLLDNLWFNYNWDWDNGVYIYNAYYHFKDAYDNQYRLEYNGSAILLNGSEVNVNLTDITVKKPTSLLDIPGDIKIDASALTNDANLSLKLTAKSGANGKDYVIYAENVDFKNQNNNLTIDYAKVSLTHNDKEYSYFSNYIYNYDDNEEENTTAVYLKGLNATLYDTDNNPLKVSNLYVNYQKDINFTEVNGTISYLDTTLKGYIKNSDEITAYLDVQRDGYSPFTLGVVNREENGTKKGYFLISRDDTLIGGEYNSTENETDVKVITKAGVFVDITKSDENAAVVVIKDRYGNILATYDPKTQTIIYSDGSSETLY